MLNIPFRLNSICFLFERTATIQAAEQNESRIKDRVALVFSISYEIVSDFLHPNLVEANKEGKHRSTHLDQYNNSSIGEYRSDWARNRFEDGKIKFKRKPKISLRKIYMKIIQDDCFSCSCSRPLLFHNVFVVVAGWFCHPQSDRRHRTIRLSMSFSLIAVAKYG